ncbi:unnamed protein product [Rangifer tarandus platyrhynchus]|uniref:Uncharacterized protein n=1 Tax=Rangifer tarandus platyrhynchus TaxID=3082113 RepID=A0AC59ZB70_RANTA
MYCGPVSALTADASHKRLHPGPCSSVGTRATLTPVPAGEAAVALTQAEDPRLPVSRRDGHRESPAGEGESPSRLRPRGQAKRRASHTREGGSPPAACAPVPGTLSLASRPAPEGDSGVQSPPLPGNKSLRTGEPPSAARSPLPQHMLARAQAVGSLDGVSHSGRLL